VLTPIVLKKLLSIEKAEDSLFVNKQYLKCLGYSFSSYTELKTKKILFSLSKPKQTNFGPYQVKHYSDTKGELYLFFAFLT